MSSKVDEAHTTWEQRVLHPATTLAILIGAHDWSNVELATSISFLFSAKAMEDWLVGERSGKAIGLKKSQVLNLFNREESALEQLLTIRRFLLGSLSQAQVVGLPVTDILIVYVGHGDVDRHGLFSILVRSSLKGIVAPTSIRTADLISVVRNAAPQPRLFLMFDCCFAEDAVKALVNDKVAAAGMLGSAITQKQQIRDAPPRGTILLGSSSRGLPSLAPSNAKLTLFTGAFLEILEKGVPSSAPFLSFEDVWKAMRNLIKSSGMIGAPLPILHDTDQSLGDLREEAAFPNWAILPPPKPLSPERSVQDVFNEAVRLEERGDLTLALDHYIDASERGLDVAQYKLAMLYLKGTNGFPADHAKAMSLMRLAADQGHADACLLVGQDLLYPKSLSTPRKPKQATAYYRKAAEAGSRPARLHLGLAYLGEEMGLAVERDRYEGLRLLQQAAEDGDVNAARRASEELGREAQTDEDRDEAQRYLVMAAEGGDQYARERLAQTMFTDIVDDEDRFYRRALFIHEGRDDERTLMLKVRCFEQGHAGYPIDPAKALELRELAIEKGSRFIQSLRMVGDAYRCGLHGKAVDLDKAEALYNRAMAEFPYYEERLLITAGLKAIRDEF